MSGIKDYKFVFTHQNIKEPIYKNKYPHTSSYRMNCEISNQVQDVQSAAFTPFLLGKYKSINRPGFTYEINGSSSGKSLLVTLGEINFPPPKGNNHSGEVLPAWKSGFKKMNIEYESFTLKSWPDQGIYFLNKVIFSIKFDEKNDKVSSLNVDLEFNDGTNLSSNGKSETDTINGNKIDYFPVKYTHNSSTLQKKHTFSITDESELNSGKLLFVLMTEPNTKPSKSTNQLRTYILFKIGLNE